jgi:polar amino acid transport system substrate-binding protein
LSQESVVIALDQSNPPFMYADESGNAAGLYPILLTEIFNRMGVALELQAVPWRRALLLGEQGVAGVGGIYFNSERDKIYLYSEPLYFESISIYTRKENTFPFSSLDDLADKKIGVILGWSYGDEFDIARRDGLFTADPGPSDESNFNKLISGRIDCMLALAVSGDFMSFRMGIRDELVRLENPVAVNRTYLVFAKNAGYDQLLTQFNQILVQMINDGSYERIIREFLASIED